MVLKIQIPNKLTDKQRELFMEIAKLEEKIDPQNVSQENNTENGAAKEKKEKTNNENEKEDIFGKFRNMWGK